MGSEPLESGLTHIEQGLFFGGALHPAFVGDGHVHLVAYYEQAAAWTAQLAEDSVELLENREHVS